MSVLVVWGGAADKVSPPVREVELSDVGGRGGKTGRGMDCNVDVIGTV